MRPLSCIALVSLITASSACRRYGGSGDDDDADPHDADTDVDADTEHDASADADADEDADPHDADPDREVADADEDAEDGPVHCDPVPTFYEGNDPALRHACGYVCDSDWCACDACMVQSGPSVPHPVGSYEVTFFGGPSSSLTYVFAVHDATAGSDLVSETATYADFFHHTLAFTSPPGCHQLEYRITTLQDVCTRLYDVTLVVRDG